MQFLAFPGRVRRPVTLGFSCVCRLNSIVFVYFVNATTQEGPASWQFDPCSTPSTCSASPEGSARFSSQSSFRQLWHSPISFHAVAPARQKFASSRALHVFEFILQPPKALFHVFRLSIFTR